ncbi:hypothetical protein [Alkalimarinus coralli]|uniref:hypothetical protein n=1 Tax=Alkalimarinus coralli TaxID=2935863 RepID=UPI00202B48E8|nr:hypothetical protein [Alkalimarinus coralli]
MKKHTWFQLDEHPEVYFGQYIVPNFISNSVAIQTSEKHWVFISPGEKLLNAWLEKWGDQEITISIIFPNSFHYMGVNAWLEKFPDAKLYASEKASRRLKKKGFQNILPLENNRPELPAGYQVLIPPGHRGGDVWLSKRDDAQNNLWITCDSFLNYERVSNQPVARALQKVLDAAPGLKISQVIKWLLLDRRSAFKPWVLHQLQQDKPRILIPSHGEVERDSKLTERLEALIMKSL